MKIPKIILSLILSLVFYGCASDKCPTIKWCTPCWLSGHEWQYYHSYYNLGSNEIINYEGYVCKKCDKRK